MKTTTAIVLAAGQGTRMKSTLPKVLHPCADKPLVAYSIEAALAAKCAPIVVVLSPNSQRVRDVIEATFPNAPLQFATQRKQRGTGDAAKAGFDALKTRSNRTVILYGDTPLLTRKTLSALLRPGKHALSFLTATVDDPSGFGRVVRNDDKRLSIVEDKDCDAAQRGVKEINVGVYACDTKLLAKGLAQLDNKNAQSEFYLTDLIAMAEDDGGAKAVSCTDTQEHLGVNDRRQLALAHQVLMQRRIEHWQSKGVTVLEPATVSIGPNVKLAQDVLVGPGTRLSGDTVVGEHTQLIGPCVLKNATIGKHVRIEPYTHVEDARVDSHAVAGPFARLRPQAHVMSEAKVGNFVELKKTKLGKGAKANHLAYLGDADIGAEANIGAGTITCNYDGGPVKHQTKLGKGVFVGSNTTLVAPVTLGAQAYVAAGSTVTRDAPAHALVFGRARQAIKKGYAKLIRARFGKSK